MGQRAMIKEIHTKERGPGDRSEHGGHESRVKCPRRKRKGCVGQGGWEGGVGDVPLGLTHKCLTTNGKGSGCLVGMKQAPRLNV